MVVQKHKLQIIEQEFIWNWTVQSMHPESWIHSYCSYINFQQSMKWDWYEWYFEFLLQSTNRWRITVWVLI